MVAVRMFEKYDMFGGVGDGGPTAGAMKGWCLELEEEVGGATRELAWSTGHKWRRYDKQSS